MTTEAQRLAEELEHIDHERWDVLNRAARELRRLHEVNAELLEALTTCVCAMQDYQAGIGITEMFDKGERIGRAVIAKHGGAA